MDESLLAAIEEIKRLVLYGDIDVYDYPELLDLSDAIEDAR